MAIKKDMDASGKYRFKEVQPTKNLAQDISKKKKKKRRIHGDPNKVETKLR